MVLHAVHDKMLQYAPALEGIYIAAPAGQLDIPFDLLSAQSIQQRISFRLLIFKAGLQRS